MFNVVVYNSQGEVVVIYQSVTVAGLVYLYGTISLDYRLESQPVPETVLTES